MKKILTILLMTLLAMFTYAAFADEVLIEKTVYEGWGIVDVDFVWDILYDNLTVTVQDAEGSSYEVTVFECDDDDLTFRVNNLIPGREYSYTVSGVRSGFSGSFSSVSGSFTVPKDETFAIRKVSYDYEDRELDVEFFAPVDLQGVSLRVIDGAGKEYEAKTRDIERDGFEAYVPGLEWGAAYTIEVAGIDDAAGIPFTFVAFDD